MKFTADEIIETVKGTVVQNKFNFGKIGISTDSRTVKEDDIFLPLSGENFDGHDFINTALKHGCTGYFIDKKHYAETSDYYNPSKIVIVVDSPIEAYLRLAHFARKKINPKVIAVTGSSGKTTVKEMIRSVLSEKYITHHSVLNHNNEIGLCETLTGMPEDTEVLVAEFGMRGAGEIELLSKYAEPDYAVIVNIGSAHIGRLGSIENIAKAKCEIIKHLKKDGTLIAADDKLIRKYRCQKTNEIYCGKNYKLLEMTEKFVKFSYEGNKYRILVPGEYNVMNAVFAIETGKLAGLSPAEIAKGLLKYKPVGERGQIINLPGNIKIISDCYNANPDSIKASVNSMFLTYPEYNVTVLLGEIAELGEHEEILYREIGKFLSEKNFYRFITVGEKAKPIAKSFSELRTDKKTKVESFSDNKEAAKFLKKNLSSKSVVLLKASRCAKLEEIVEELSVPTPA